MPSTAFNYEIVEKVAVLSQSGDTTKELNRVSYNGSPAKYDLRSWRRMDGEEINRQAEETQRELQRIADEADEAIRGTL